MPNLVERNAKLVNSSSRMLLTIHVLSNALVVHTSMVSSASRNVLLIPMPITSLAIVLVLNNVNLMSLLIIEVVFMFVLLVNSLNKQALVLRYAKLAPKSFLQMVSVVQRIALLLMFMMLTLSNA